MDEVACEVWTATLADLRTEHLAVVSEFERARADRFRRPDDRTRSLLGAVVLRAVAARHLDVAASDVEIGRTCTRCGGSHGRPTVAGGPSMSVSHSGDVVVVAATTVAPVTARERGHLSSPKDVLICWTRKEAFLKATGEGLNVPLTDLCVTAPDRPPAIVERAGVPAVRCAMSDLRLRPGHVGTVAVLGADSADTFFGEVCAHAAHTSPKKACRVGCDRAVGAMARDDGGRSNRARLRRPIGRQTCRPTMPSPEPTTHHPTDHATSLDDLVAAADPASNRDPVASEEAARNLRRVAAETGDQERSLEAEVWICIHLLQQGRLREAVAESLGVRDRLSPEPPGSRLGAARMKLLRTITLAASETGDFAAALDAAQELAADPAVHADARAAFDAAFSLAVCLERMGDSWQAMRILNDVIDRHGDAAPSFPMLYALNGLAATAIGAFHRVHDESGGDAAALLATARAAAERALDLLDEFGNPLYRVATGGNLGEVLAHQGELAEARALLDGALELAEEIGAVAHRDRVRASIGEWLVLSERHQEALAWLGRLVADLGDDGPHSTRTRAHHSAYRAARALDRHELALEHLEAYERLARHRTTSQLRSQSEMFVTKSEAQAEADRHRSSAERDPLTGLGNRRYLNRMLHVLLHPARYDRPTAIAMIDVDHFKSINDELGHTSGDAVLVELAHILGDEVRDDDVIVRYGGEEIVVVMPGATVEDAAARCEELRARVGRHIWPSLPPDRRITISAGIAATPPCDHEVVVSAADRAMYAAKRAGRNQVRIATDDDIRDATPLALPRP